MLKPPTISAVGRRIAHTRHVHTSAVARQHSHTHANAHANAHTNAHTHTHTGLGSSDEVTCSGHSHATSIPKPDPASDPLARFDIDAQGRKKLKAHPFQSVHAHDDANFPELRELQLEGEDFEIRLNDPKPTLWTKVKRFFDPEAPLFAAAAHSQSAQASASAAHSHSHADGSSGHSHTHGAHSAEQLEFYKTGAFRKNPGVKITLIGLGVNVGMAATKAVTGTYFHSQALIADAVHSVGDTISDVLTLATVNSAVKVPSATYPLGFGKIETLGSLFVSTILLYAGFQIGWSSLIDVLTPMLPHSVIDAMATVPVHSHSHTGVEHVHAHVHAAEPQVREVANINAAWVAAGSIVVKEWLFRATKRVGDSMGSKVLVANAWHHRVDSMTSLVALSTISAGYFLNVYWLDSIGGLIVSAMVMKVGFGGVVQAFKELVDRAVPPTDPRYDDLESKINVLLMRSDANFVIKDLVLLPSGANLNCHITIGVPPYNKGYESQLTLDKVNAISKDLKDSLYRDAPNLKRVSVEVAGNN